MILDEMLHADILLAPRPWHEFFLMQRNKNPFLAFKLMTKEDLLKGFFFDFSDKAIPHLMVHQNVSYELAKTFLANLHFLPKQLSEDAQIQRLQTMQSELDQNNLLKHDDLFLPLMKKKKIEIFGYDESDRELTSVLDAMSSNYAFGNIPTSKDSVKLNAYHFETIEDELQWVYNQISLLLSKDVSLDDIYFYDPPSEYRFLLKKLSSFYEIPVNFPSELTLAASRPGIDFLSMLLQGMSPEEALKTFVRDDMDSVEIQLVDVVTALLPVDMPPSMVHDFFLNHFREVTLHEDRFDHAVNILKGNFFPEGSHIFLLGFNEGNFPSVIKNVDYLDDLKKIQLGRNDSVYENQMREKAILSLIDGTHDVTITLKKQSLTDTYKPSPLISKLSINVITNPLSDVEFGQEWAKIRLAEYMDGERKYQKQHPLQKSLSLQLPIPFRKYDHRFSGVRAVNPASKGKYSYTSLSEFFECQFKYYLDRILGIDPFEDTFYTKFGKLAHAVLEKKYQDAFDFDTVFDQEVQAQEFSIKEKVLLNRLKTEIANVIVFNDGHESTMLGKEVLTEKRIEAPIDPSISLVGVIDKVILTGKEARYVSLVDYKTGTVDFNPNHIRFGYSLQLPIYALLASRDVYLASHEVIGLYIQTIITKKLIRPSGKDAQKFYSDQFRLTGLFSDDFEKLVTFDGTYRDSRFIKSLKVTQIGALAAFAQKRAFSKEVLTRYIDTTLEKIREADAAIKANDFKINPKSLDNGELPCKYCTYRDICFRDEADVVHLNTKENNDGEMDA